jgi:MFS family permease
MKTDDPILEISLFKDRNFLIMNLVICLIFFSLSGVTYLMPFFLEYVSGYSTVNAGLILTSLSLAMMVSGLLAGILYDKIGGRHVSIIAAFILIAGYYLITHLAVDSTTVFVTLCLGILGFGLGMIVTPLCNMIMTSSSKKYEGMVSSLISLDRFVPLTIGIAFFNSFFIRGMLSIAKQYGVTQQSPALIQLKVLTAGFDLSFFVAFVIGILIFILTLVLRYKMHPDYIASTNEDLVEARI